MAGAAMVALVVVNQAHAALVTQTFSMEYSNELADGGDYGIVTIEADDVAGTVQFDVTAPYVYSGSPGNHFGFQTFYFNTLDLDLGTDFSLVLPSDWSAEQKGYNVSEFGSFDLRLKAKGGNDALANLSFTLQMNDGLESLATINNFANFSGPDKGKPALHYFAGHVLDFASTSGQTSHHIASAVPEPSAFVLWGVCGVLGLLAARRFRR